MSLGYNVTQFPAFSAKKTFTKGYSRKLWLVGHLIY